jgi:hypothetical protein
LNWEPSNLGRPNKTLKHIVYSCTNPAELDIAPDQQNPEADVGGTSARIAAVLAMPQMGGDSRKATGARQSISTTNKTKESKQ